VHTVGFCNPRPLPAHTFMASSRLGRWWRSKLVSNPPFNLSRSWKAAAHSLPAAKGCGPVGRLQSELRNQLLQRQQQQQQQHTHDCQRLLAEPWAASAPLQLCCGVRRARSDVLACLFCSGLFFLLSFLLCMPGHLARLPQGCPPAGMCVESDMYMDGRVRAGTPDSMMRTLLVVIG
jgi:hypothetical protein